MQITSSFSFSGNFKEKVFLPFSSGIRLKNALYTVTKFDGLHHINITLKKAIHLHIKILEYINVKYEQGPSIGQHMGTFL